VPGLADVPFFGNLFKSESRSRNKTNLMVFLRPMVVRDAQATDRLSMDRYELMRAGAKEIQPVPSEVLQINAAPQLPVLSSAKSLLVPAVPAAKTEP
jgi:general secretion pathway protein D